MALSNIRTEGDKKSGTTNTFNFLNTHNLNSLFSIIYYHDILYSYIFILSRYHESSKYYIILI